LQEGTDTIRVAAVGKNSIRVDVEEEEEEEEEEEVVVVVVVVVPPLLLLLLLLLQLLLCSTHLNQTAADSTSSVVELGLESLMEFFHIPGSSSRSSSLVH